MTKNSVRSWDYTALVRVMVWAKSNYMKKWENVCAQFFADGHAMSDSEEKGCACTVVSYKYFIRLCHTYISCD